MKRILCGLLVVLMIAALLAGCEKAEEPAAAPPVTLTIVGAWEDCKAIDAVGREFTALYPNCTIQYEYLQNYYESLEKRLPGENNVDLFFTTNIQDGSTLLPFALDLNSREDLDLSQTFPGLIENFAYMDNGVRSDSLYAIPLGAEMRGLYINKTLLDSLGIPIPTDQASLLAACETLKANGYIPFHGNPGEFSQTLLYPWICNLIANADDPDAAYALVNDRGEGVSELLREPFAFMYTLIENGYYDYKRAQSDLNLFVDSTTLDYARYFLNIRQNGDVWEKADDIGQIAFMPSPISIRSTLDKVKDDYHSEIEYVFVPAPVGQEGGFVYLSPAHGIAINQTSANLDWAVLFLDFLFQPEHNELFASTFHVIPNTSAALDYVSDMFDIPASRVSQLGQVTFDYDFYGIVTGCLRDVSKANNPKYMIANDDGTTSLYPLDSYLATLEAGIKGDE